MNKRPVQLLILLLCALCFVQGTLAWQNMEQTATNEMYMEGTSSAVRLIKLEKLSNGAETENPLAGAEFMLLSEDGEKLGGPYITDKDGVVQPEKKLPVGKYFFEETQTLPGYTFDVDEDGNDITRYEFEVLGDKADVEVVAYNRRRVGALILTKQVENTDGSELSTDQLRQEFEFTVTFAGELGAEGVTCTLNDGEEKLFSLDENGRGTLKLKHGDTAVLENLPYGVRYTVEETPVEGYSIFSVGSYGHITEDGARAKFVNTAEKVQPVTGSLIVRKLVRSTADETNAEQLFYFNAAIGDETHAFELKAGDEWRIDGIAHGTAFSVRENVNTESYPSGYHPTVTEYTGTVTAGQSVLAEFVNVLDEAPGGKTGVLEISKTVADENAELAFEFTVNFSAYPEDGSNYTYTVNGGENIEFIPDENGTGTLLLYHGETARFEGIPHGVTYTVSETDAGEYIAGISRVSGTIVGGESAKAAFLNLPDEEITPPPVPDEEPSSLYITKTLKGKYSDDDLTAEQKQKEFAFTVTFSRLPEQGFYSYYIDGQPFILGDDGRLFLKAGQTAEIIDIPEGTVFSVLEDNYIGEEYIQTVENCYGITDGEDIHASVTNTYVGQIYLDLSGEKTWDLEDAPEEEQIALPAFVTLQLKRGTDLVGDPVTVAADENGRWKYTFAHVPKYNSEGSLIEYTVYETPVEGFVPLKGRGEYDIENVYVPPVDNTSCPIVAVKCIEGEDAPEKTFTFNLAAADNAPMPDGIKSADLTRTLTGEGEVNFGTITFTNPGIYVYTVTEAQGTSAGWKYDDSKYTVTYTVEYDEDDRELEVERLITRDGDEVEEIEFENSFDKDEAAKYTAISGTKTWAHGDNPAGRQPTEITVYLSADGEVIRESKVTAESGWMYTFEDLPILNEDGSAVEYAVSEKRIADYTATVTGYDILNTYHPTVIVPSPTVVKQVKGDNVPRETFSFVMLGANGAPMPDGSAGSTKTVAITGAGELSFGEIYFDKAGVYEYTIYELDGGVKNWIYDDTQYRFIVTVEEEGGVLSAETKLYRNNSEVSKAAFTNLYNQHGWDENVVIKGRKYWNHGSNPQLMRPKSILVCLYGNGQLEAQLNVTAEDGWEYMFVVPRYTLTGSEITYVIDEIEVDGYSKHIEGYDILNTYEGTGGGSKPGIKPKPTQKPSFSPQTGDESNLALWVAIFVVCTVGLGAMFLLTRRKDNRKSRKE